MKTDVRMDDKSSLISSCRSGAGENNAALWVAAEAAAVHTHTHTRTNTASMSDVC